MKEFEVVVFGVSRFIEAEYYTVENLANATALVLFKIEDEIVAVITAPCAIFECKIVKA